MIKFLLSWLKWAKTLESRTEDALSMFGKAIKELEQINAQAEKKVSKNADKISKAQLSNEKLEALKEGNIKVAEKLKAIVA